MRQDLPIPIPILFGRKIEVDIAAINVLAHQHHQFVLSAGQWNEVEPFVCIPIMLFLLYDGNPILSFPITHTADAFWLPEAVAFFQLFHHDGFQPFIQGEAIFAISTTEMEQLFISFYTTEPSGVFPKLGVLFF